MNEVKKAVGTKVREAPSRSLDRNLKKASQCKDDSEDCDGKIRPIGSQTRLDPANPPHSHRLYESFERANHRGYEQFRPRESLEHNSNKSETDEA
jgi:hypothetical protein